jgi:hypothetical protein
MEAGDVGRIGSKARWTGLGLKMLDMRRGNARAIAAAHQHAVLGGTEIRNAHREPYADGGQRDGKGEGRNVRQHAMTKIVRFFPVALIPRQVIRLLPGVLLASVFLPSVFMRSVLMRSFRAKVSLRTRRPSRATRPEFEHAMLFFRCNGPLGFHLCQLRDMLMLFSTLATRLTGNVGMNVDMAQML